MPVYYLETSALFKAYRTEVGSPVVRELLNQAQEQDRFYTSFLTVLEISAAVHRLVGAHHLDQVAAQHLLSRFRADVNKQFRLWPMSNRVVRQAVPVTEQHRLRAADAIHLASALAIAARVAPATVVMVTGDQELIRAARSTGLLIPALRSKPSAHHA